MNASDFDKAILLYSSYIIHLDDIQHWFELRFLKQFYKDLFNKQFAIEAEEFTRKNLTGQLDIALLSRELKEITTEQARIQLLFYFFDLAVSDGKLHDLELDFIKNISILLDISDKHYESILATYALYNPSLRQKFLQDLQIHTNDQLIVAYKILEVSPNVSDTELKTAYKRLVKEHHPDKMSHLGSAHVEKAVTILQRINEAYEYICNHRNI